MRMLALGRKPMATVDHSRRRRLDPDAALSHFFLHATRVSILQSRRSTAQLSSTSDHPPILRRLSTSSIRLQTRDRHPCVSITRRPTPLQGPQARFLFPKAPPSYLKYIQIQIHPRRRVVRAKERLLHIHWTAHHATPLSINHPPSLNLHLQSNSTAHSTSPVDLSIRPQSHRIATLLFQSQDRRSPPKSSSALSPTLSRRLRTSNQYKYKLKFTFALRQR
ncbi:hypothetical protein R3P38DRAFT_3102581 [Favolaschia claudopus]|uniref:Uncharacterized protein n=1 Tax=Favolaschia claudopus TaxID=2862362 RepID=A0AAV9ZLH2_9AGAR